MIVQTSPFKPGTSQQPMNTISILVEEQANDRFAATVWGLPDCRALGATREEALTAVQALLANRLQQAEVVTYQMPQVEHPLVKLAGTFKDDPYFDEMLDSISTYRRELDAVSDGLGVERSAL
jgi:predicted RNase H-like HicB family nuclease